MFDFERKLENVLFELQKIIEIFAVIEQEIESIKQIVDKMGKED